MVSCRSWVTCWLLVALATAFAMQACQSQELNKIPVDPATDGGYATATGGRGSDNGGVSPEDGGVGSGRCQRPATCEGYCANVSQPSECTPSGVESPCVEYCRTEIDLHVPEQCRDQWIAALECVACAELTCKPECVVGAGGEGSGFVEQCDEPFEPTGCEALAEAVGECSGPCLRDDSTEQNGQTSYYLTSYCECPSALAPGGSDGEPCSSFFDCAEICCECPASPARYVARRCEDGVCMGGARLCAAALEDATNVGLYCTNVEEDPSRP